MEDLAALSGDAAGSEGLEAAPAPRPAPVPIWAALQDVVTLATHCLTQMRTIAGGLGPLSVAGFDRPAMDVTARWLGISIDAEMCGDIACLEAEAGRRLNKRGEA